MKVCWAVFSMRFRLLLQYRAAALAGLVTQAMWGFLITMGLAAYYRAAQTEPPMPLGQVFSYVWLGQAVFALLPWTVDPEIRVLIRRGDVACELLRPVGLYALWFARALALRSAPTLLRAVPLGVIAWLWFGLELPPTWSAGAAALASFPGALALSAAITVIAGTTLFWTISGEGVTHFLPAVVLLFSGNLLPLPLFPDWAQPILTALPFRGIMDAPFRLYVGHISAADVGAVLLHQWIWVLVLLGAGQWLMARGLRGLVVQGG